MNQKADLPCRQTMCATCPFRFGSPYQYLADTLAQSALSEASRVCHSTGEGNAINSTTGKPEHLCRGARDIQLSAFHQAGVITAPTDAAWNAQRNKIGLKPTIIKDP